MVGGRVRLIYFVLAVLAAADVTEALALSRGQAARADSLTPLEDIYRDGDGDGAADLLGERVTVRGTANVGSGIYHERFLQIFLQNDSRGLSLFAESFDEEISPGDVVRATGTVQNYFGLVEVNVESYEIVDHRPVDSLRTVPLDSILGNPRPYLGMSVRGRGVVVDKGHRYNGKFLRLSSADTADEETLLFYVTNFHSRYGDFDFEKASVGDEVLVGGVVSRYDPGEGSELVYSIFPRTAGDYTFSGVPRQYLVMAIALLGGLGIVVGIWIVLLRRQVRKKTEKLSESLEEKQVLLQEIHHRVKNNLAIISGLIDLQMDRTDDESARRVLEDSQSRIRSMALVHDKLYRSDSLKGIGMRKYFTDLVEAIHRTFESNEDVSLNVEVEDIMLDLDKVIPCGLLVNELAVNAFKHAFAEGGGVLEVSLRERNGTARLRIADDGPGLPDDFSFSSTESLGMMLVQTFADQLGAEIAVNGGERGASFTFVFPLDNKEAG